jgi:hypothetical protein
VKLKLGELNARMLCQYTAFAEVVSGIFGKKDEAGGKPLIEGKYTDLSKAHSFEQALANINNALTFG